MIAQRKPNNDKGFKEFSRDFADRSATPPFFDPRQPDRIRSRIPPRDRPLVFANGRPDGAAQRLVRLGRHVF
ncbi:protein of unknown function [Burkholderia multivorans]